MNIARLIRKIKEVWFEGAPKVSGIVDAAAWLVFVLPFFLIGYMSQKLVAGFLVGWIVSRDYD